MYAHVCLSYVIYACVSLSVLYAHVSVWNPGVGSNTCDPCPTKAEAGGLLQPPGLLGLQYETLPQKLRNIHTHQNKKPIEAGNADSGFPLPALPKQKATNITK